MKYTITSLIESLKNCPENYVLTDGGDISNYLGVNINKNSDGTFKSSQSHLVEKIINNVGLIVFMSLKARDTPAGKPLLHKDLSSLGRDSIWNYRAAGDMLSCLWGSILLEISMDVH